MLHLHTNRPSSPAQRGHHFLALSLLLVSLIAGSGLAAPASALASTLDSDIICGSAVKDRDLSSSDAPDIEARHAIVMDANGTIYFERDADTQTKIASITKVMTAIVALENADLSDTITVDHAAATVGESTAHLEEGDTMTLETALKALLIPSGNDAAMAIASSVGALIDPDSDSPYDTFVAAMNQKAQELGMDAQFTNPHGLDFGKWEDDMHASAHDVAIMFSYAMKNDDFRRLDGSDDNVITVTSTDGSERSIKLEIINTILGQDGNVGGKTGNTSDAGTCFAGVFERDDRELYVVVLGCDTKQQRFTDSIALTDWYFDHLVSAPIVNSTKTTAEGDTLVARATDTDWVDKTVDLMAEDPDATVEYFDLAGEVSVEAYPAELSGNIKRGDAAGTLVCYQDDEALGAVNLVAAEDVAEPNPLEWLLVQFDRLVRLVTGQPRTAEAEVYATAPTA